MNATSKVDRFSSQICSHDVANIKLGCRECVIELVESVFCEAYDEGMKNAPIKEVVKYKGYGCGLCGDLFCKESCFK